MILGNRMRKAISGKVTRDRLPAFSLVSRLEHVRLIVTAFMVFHNGIHDVHVVRRACTSST